MEGILAESINPSWIFGILLLILGSLAYFVQQHPKLFVYYWKSSIGNIQTYQLNRDESQSSQTIGFGIDLMSIAIFVLFFAALLKRFPQYVLFQSDYLIWFITVGITLIVLFKKTIVWLLGILFQEPEMSEIHRTQMTVNNRVLALIVLPIAVIGLYSDPSTSVYVLSSGLVICVLQYIYRLLKLLVTGFRIISLPKYFSILYLCTLEILPILLLVKWLR